MPGKQLVNGGQAAALDAVEDERGQARYPDDVPPVVAVDDGQVLTADLLAYPPGHGRAAAILEPMIDPRPQADRILVAQLTGEARHRARWRELTASEEGAAVAELRELAGGRADLLAEVAGILEGTSEDELDEPLARQAAGLCRAAGADPEAIPGWVAEGRRRRVAARQPPFSGGLHGT